MNHSSFSAVLGLLLFAASAAAQNPVEQVRIRSKRIPIAYTLGVSAGSEIFDLELGIQKHIGDWFAIDATAGLRHQARALDRSTAMSDADVLVSSGNRGGDLWCARYRIRSMSNLGLGFSIYPLGHGKGPFLSARGHLHSFIGEGFAERFRDLDPSGESVQLDERPDIMRVEQTRYWTPGASFRLGYALRPSKRVPLSLEPSLRFSYLRAPSAEVTSPYLPNQVAATSLATSELLQASQLTFSLRATFQLSRWY